MAADDGGHVAHTAVAVFYVVSIEQLVVLVVVWEMLIHKIQEVLGNVCCHVLVEWGVEPYNVAFAVSPYCVGDHYFLRHLHRQLLPC